MPADNVILSTIVAPAYNGYSVTPSASEQPYVFRALYIGTGGDLVVTMLGNAKVSGTTITFANVPAGTLLPVVGNYVTTATTASNIVALY